MYLRRHFGGCRRSDIESVLNTKEMIGGESTRQPIGRKCEHITDMLFVGGAKG